jgi:hypothetical protein
MKKVNHRWSFQETWSLYEDQQIHGTRVKNYTLVEKEHRNVGACYARRIILQRMHNENKLAKGDLKVIEHWRYLNQWRKLNLVNFMYFMMIQDVDFAERAITGQEIEHPLPRGLKKIDIWRELPDFPEEDGIWW